MDSTTQTNTAQQPTNTTASGGDALDKGVDFLEKKAGHEQSHSTTEKISDGIRTGFKKMAGKDVPVQDKNYQ
ncbi:hypothetical protein PUNSTDRAFT_134076 [Punctularia strigosozonata HHB-11173 SS5]|uniref:uncharacterized protein n=1 Tax=Punctularia strigosozonata (strain HHB-11173) TaxID=741275 RepID=UPI000441715D|nr:uncharacterized protein PUNSTDRAFT_134076 [Punctularia strigosozonata HHB-11173 SS5]EIN08902.1 hypothetical protein PUNSTDRAFT_134076 [Punctularia strigosozonata HHB-11173 SS5]